MVYHNFTPQTYVCAKIIPILKDSKPALTEACTETLLLVM